MFLHFSPLHFQCVRFQSIFLWNGLIRWSDYHTVFISHRIHHMCTLFVGIFFFTHILHKPFQRSVYLERRYTIENILIEPEMSSAMQVEIDAQKPNQNMIAKTDWTSNFGMCISNHLWKSCCNCISNVTTDRINHIQFDNFDVWFVFNLKFYNIFGQIHKLSKTIISIIARIYSRNKTCDLIDIRSPPATYNMTYATNSLVLFVNSYFR